MEASQITVKKFIDEGLTSQFFYGLKKRFEEYRNFKECFFMLREHIYKTTLASSQKQIIAKYLRQQLLAQWKGQEKQKKENASKLKKGVIGGASGAVGSVATGAAVSAAGFTTSGVAAGSLAAGMQATMGAVQAGSAFATMQSLGATGAFVGPVGLLAGTAVGLGVVGGKMAYDKYQDHKKWEYQNKQILDLCKELEK